MCISTAKFTYLYHYYSIIFKYFILFLIIKLNNNKNFIFERHEKISNAIMIYHASLSMGTIDMSLDYHKFIIIFNKVAYNDDQDKS
jgi:hypothetical protein